MSWYKIRDQQVELSILAKPKAKKTTLIKISEQGLHIAVHAKPHQGEANKELISYLAELFHLAKSQIILLRGDRSRHKRVLVPLNNTVRKLLEQATANKSRGPLA